MMYKSLENPNEINPEFEIIQSFYSMGHYRRFLEWITKHIENNKVIEIPITTDNLYYYNTTRLFKLPHSEQIWALKKADSPLGGGFHPLG